MAHITFLFFFFFPGVFGWLIFTFFLLPYFLPTIIAIFRGHHNAGGIFVLNFLLGWTVIGWVASLLMAVSSNRPTVIVNNSSPAYQPEMQEPARRTAPTLRPMDNKTSMASQQEKINLLRQLKELLDEGALTEEEYNKQKTKLIG